MPSDLAGGQSDTKSGVTILCICVTSSSLDIICVDISEIKYSSSHVLSHKVVRGRIFGSSAISSFNL